MEMTGIKLIAKERQRQVKKEGFSSDHDAPYLRGELALAAVSYALPKKDVLYKPFFWPFDPKWYKPTPNDRIRELSKAGALIAAEIDRLLEAEKQQAQ